MLIYEGKVGYLLCPTEMPALMDMETRSGLSFWFHSPFQSFFPQGLVEIQQINDHRDFTEICTYMHVRATLKVGRLAHPPARVVQH